MAASVETAAMTTPVVLTPPGREHLVNVFTHFLLNKRVLTVKLCWVANH